MSLLIELHYLPCVQYFAKLVQHEDTWIEQKEHYSKGSYRNRCYIAGANGVQLLSIPLVKGKNEQQPIRDTRIAYDMPWQIQHWRTIQSAYGNSPYFEYYEDGLAAFYRKKYDFLFDFNYDLLLWLTAKLQLELSIRLTEAYQNVAEPGIEDWRNGIHPKPQRQRVDPVFKPAYYPQPFEERHGFLSNLSILDLIFCTGPQAGMILESKT
jgi:WbqC-like protein family